jgi:type I restriction enzyme R subunit
VGIETILDAGLPEVYDRSLFSRKSQDIYQHVFTSYQGGGQSVYGEAA